MEHYQELIAPNPRVAMIHASLDDDVADAAKWARAEKFPWPTVLLDEHEATGLDTLGGQEQVPDTVLVDKDGKVLTRDEEEAFAKIAALK